MEITGMGDGQRGSRMPSATLMRWRKRPAITDTRWRRRVISTYTACHTKRVVLQPTEYPLAVEQHHGITLDRVKQIAAGAGHL